MCMYFTKLIFSYSILKIKQECEKYVQLVFNMFWGEGEGDRLGDKSTGV